MKKTLISLVSITSFGLPMLALADAVTFKTTYFDSLVRGGLSIVKLLVVFLVSLAVVWFIWNVIKYSMSDSEDDKTKAKSQMINGIIAIAVIVSIWGIVYLLQATFLYGSRGNAPLDLEKMIP